MRHTFADLDPAGMERLGRALGRAALPNTILALTGTLGAGKTFFTRALALGLDIPEPRAVISPTFVLMQIYEARLPVYHFDTYRLANPAAFADLGVDEYYRGEGVCVIEWAERVAELLPADRLDLEFVIGDNDRRTVEAAARGPHHETILQAWQREFASA